MASVVDGDSLRRHTETEQEQPADHNDQRDSHTPPVSHGWRPIELLNSPRHWRTLADATVPSSRLHARADREQLPQSESYSTKSRGSRAIGVMRPLPLPYEWPTLLHVLEPDRRLDGRNP